MKIVIVGAFGTVGSKVVEVLQPNHELIRVGRTRGDVTVDYRSPESIRAMYETIGPVDAVIVAAGGGAFFGPLEKIGTDEFHIGLNGKLMGQINIALIGREYVNNGGSITLTSGFLSHFPNPYSVVVGTVNTAVDAFVFQAAGVMPNDIRINVVSPAAVVDSPAPPGSGRVTRAETAAAYLESIEGDFTGRVLQVWNVKL